MVYTFCVKIFLLYKINCGLISLRPTCALMAMADFEEINRPWMKISYGIHLCDWHCVSQIHWFPVLWKFGWLQRTQTPLKTFLFSQLSSNWCKYPLKSPWVWEISLTTSPYLLSLSVKKKTRRSSRSVCYDWLIFQFILLTVLGAKSAFSVSWKYFSLTLEVCREVCVPPVTIQEVWGGVHSTQHLHLRQCLCSISNTALCHSGG